MDEIYVLGTGMTPFGRLPDRSVKSLVAEAVGEAFRDAGCEAGDIEAAYMSNTTQGVMEGQHLIRGQIVLRAMGIEGIPVVNVENACASGSTAFHMAVQHLKAGNAEVVLAVGFEKMYGPDKVKSGAIFDGGWDVEEGAAVAAALAAIGEGVDIPDGRGPGVPSPFMQLYASLARGHMREFGTTERQLAAVAAKNHRHSVDNPLSQFRDSYSVEQILAGKVIAWPLTLPMCSPISDGAAAAILCKRSALSRFTEARPVRVLSTVLTSGSARPWEAADRHLCRAAAFKAYDAAGIGPEDISVAEVHDASAFAEIVQVENLGFCPIGEGGRLAETGETALGGRLPVNPSGGLESKGHPIGATGLGAGPRTRPAASRPGRDASGRECPLRGRRERRRLHRRRGGGRGRHDPRRRLTCPTRSPPMIPDSFRGRLSLPAMVSPMFLVSGPDLVVATCQAGLLGSFPTLNQRTAEGFEAWLIEIRRRLGPGDAPFGTQFGIHHTNPRQAPDLALAIKYEVPVLITTLGITREITDAVHAYGGLVFHDATTIRHARKGLEAGVDGIIAVTQGAGGHSGSYNPFAFLAELRPLMGDKTLILAGAISDGLGIAGAIAAGADMVSLGTCFIPTTESMAPIAQKQMILDFDRRRHRLHRRRLGHGRELPRPDPQELRPGQPSQGLQRRGRDHAEGLARLLERRPGCRRQPLHRLDGRARRPIAGGVRERRPPRAGRQASARTVETGAPARPGSLKPDKHNGRDKMIRRLTGVVLATALLSTMATAQDAPVKLGILTDMTGAYAALTGEGSATAARMAVEDFGGKVLGQPVVVVAGDHNGKPDIAANLARSWYERDGVDAIFDGGGSAPALAMLEIAKSRGKIVAFSGVVTPDVTGKLCGETVSSWAWDTHAMVASSMATLMRDKAGKKRVFFVTLDAGVGRLLEGDATKIIEANGGTVVGSIKHPLNNADFSSFLLQAQAAKPDVIVLANAGRDTVNAMKQAGEFGLTSGPSPIVVAGVLATINDIEALGLGLAKGVVVSESFYWNLSDETRAWNRRFEQRTGAAANMLQAAVYSSVLHYLKGVEKAGSRDGTAVAAAMKSMPVNDFYSKDVVLRADGRAVRDFYLFRVKDKGQSSGRWDVYETVNRVPGVEAFPAALSQCPLMKQG